MKVVILAGGFGSRISEESHVRPKPMVEIGGMPILWHIMKYYSYYGNNEFIICCGFKGYLIKEYFANYYLHRADVTFDFAADNKMIVHNNVAEPWKVTLIDTGLNTQTGGRIKRIQKYIGDETFFMTYGDGLSDVDLSALVKQHRESGKTATLTTIQPGVRFGVLDIDNENNIVVGFHEKSPKTGVWINAGFMLLEPEVFEYIENDMTVFEREPLEKMSAKGELGVYRHHGFWQCMDTQRDKEVLEKYWASENVPWAVWETTK